VEEEEDEDEEEEEDACDIDTAGDFSICVVFLISK
jgi:hypothetical protein